MISCTHRGIGQAASLELRTGWNWSLLPTFRLGDAGCECRLESVARRVARQADAAVTGIGGGSPLALRAADLEPG